MVTRQWGKEPRETNVEKWKFKIRHRMQFCGVGLRT